MIPAALRSFGHTLALAAVALLPTACVLNHVTDGPRLQQDKTTRTLPFDVLVLSEPCVRNSLGLPTGRTLLADAFARRRMRNALKRGTLGCEERAPRDWYPISLLATHPPARYFLANKKAGGKIVAAKWKRLMGVHRALYRKDIPGSSHTLRFRTTVDLADFQRLRATRRHFLNIKLLGFVDEVHGSSCFSYLTLLVLPGFQEERLLLHADYYDLAGERMSASPSTNYSSTLGALAASARRGQAALGGGQSFRAPRFRKWTGWVFFLWGLVVSDSRSDYYRQTTIKAYNAIEKNRRQI